MQRTLLTWAIGFCLVVIATLLWDRSQALSMIVLAVGGTLLIVLNAGNKQRDDEGTEMDGLFVVPSSASEARAAALLPTEGSEDATELVAPLRALRRPAETPEEYGPEASTEWWVSASFETPVPTGALLMPRTESRACGGPMIFGRGPDGRMTYAHAAGEGGPFSEVVLAWPYCPLEGGALAESEVREWSRRGSAWLAELPGAGVATDFDPAEVVARSASLLKLREESRPDMLFEVRAPAGERFRGTDVWDVMLSAGLRWGDMDLFHLENHEGAGDDVWFSVGSTSAPGYFLPEEIAAGRGDVGDLQFRLNAARITHPVEALDVMLAVGEYAARRLGGELMLGESPLPRDSMREHAAELARELADAGFAPGSDAAMRLF